MVALAQHAAKKMKTSLCGGLVLMALVSSSQALGETVFESSYTRFIGEKYRDNLGSVSLDYSGDHFAESGYSTQIYGRQSFMQSFGPDAYGKSAESLVRRSTIGFDQTIESLSTVGAAYGYSLTTGSAKTENRFYFVRGGHWWNKATILTNVEITESGTDRKSRDYLDRDGFRVLVPGYVSGKIYSLGLTWLATRNCMIMARANTSTSSDRPIADSGSLEGRYFLATTLTALHLKIGAYNDRSAVAQTTDYGQIRGREIEGQIHQHLTDRWIGAFVYRLHWETEVPRAMDSPNVDRNALASQVRLRWRNVTGPVTDNVSEVYGYIGQYQSTEPDSLIRHFGIGGKYVL